MNKKMSSDFKKNKQEILNFVGFVVSISALATLMISHFYLEGGVFWLVTLGVVFVLLTALRYARSPFLMLPLILIAWEVFHYYVRDFLAIMFKNAWWPTICFWGGMVMVSCILDLKKKKGFAFLGYLISGFFFWAHLTMFFLCQPNALTTVLLTGVLFVLFFLLSRQVIFVALGAFSILGPIGWTGILPDFLHVIFIFPIHIVQLTFVYLSPS